MATPNFPPVEHPPARPRLRRKTAVGLVLVVLGTILALVGPSASPVGAMESNGMQSIGVDTTPTNLANYPNGTFPAGCNAQDGQVLTEVNYAAEGPGVDTSGTGLGSLGYLPAGTVITMSWDEWVEGCLTPISLSTKRAVGPEFDAATDQALLAFVGCSPLEGDGIDPCVEDENGRYSLVLTMPASGADCSYQNDAVIGPPLDVVGPDGSFYGEGLRASNDKGEGPSMLISADNKGPEGGAGPNCQPPSATLECAEDNAGIVVTINNPDVFDDIRVTIRVDGQDAATDFEVLKTSSRTFTIPTGTPGDRLIEVFDPQRQILAPTPFAGVCTSGFQVERLCQEGDILVTVTDTEGVDFVVEADGVAVEPDENGEYHTPIGDEPVTIEVFADGTSLGTQEIQPCDEPTAAASVDCAVNTITVTTTQPETHLVTFEVTVNGNVITDNVDGVYTYVLSNIEALEAATVVVTATHNGTETTLVDDTVNPCDTPIVAACVTGKSAIERFTATDVFNHLDGQFAVNIDEASGTWSSTVPIDFIMVVENNAIVRSFVLPGNFTSGSFTATTVTVTVNGSPVVVNGVVTDAAGNPVAASVSAAAVGTVTSVTYCDGQEPPTEVQGVQQTQTQPATLPRTGGEDAGRMALALGLVVTGLGLVLFGEDRRLGLLIHRR